MRYSYSRKIQKKAKSPGDFMEGEADHEDTKLTDAKTRATREEATAERTHDISIRAIGVVL
jgi:hypothetical protein